MYTKTVVAPYTADQTYYLRMEMNNPADKDYDRSDPYGMRFVQWAAVGDFKTAESIKAQPDIKSQLFSSPAIPPITAAAWSSLLWQRTVRSIR